MKYKIGSFIQRISLIRILNVLAVALTVFVFFPLKISQVLTNLDNSEMYLLNVMNSMGVKAGTDVVFSYGPLGFLYNTINYGSNVLISVLFYCLVTVAFAFMLFRVARRLPGIQGALVLLFGTFVIMTSRSSGSLTCDYALSYVLFLALSIAWFDKKPMGYFGFACVLTVILGLIKFNAILEAYSAIVIFAVCRVAIDKKKALKFVIAAIAVPLLFICVYLIYQPSFGGFVGYVKGSMEISSGYNTAMSLTPDTRYLVVAFLCVLSYCVLLAVLLAADLKRGMYLLIYCGAFFQVFKHGFVRADMHISYFFSNFLLLFSLIALFLDYEALRQFIKRRRGLTIPVFMAVVVVVSGPLFALNQAPLAYVNMLTSRFNEIRTGIAYKLENPVSSTDMDVLPDAVLNIIGDSSVAILPDELSIGAYNDIHMSVFPTLQLLMPYTSYLDKLNVDYFSDSGRAPEYLYIHRFTAIDNRIPILECPSTWEAIYHNYYAVFVKGDTCLLKRMDKPYTSVYSGQTSAVYGKYDTIPIPDNVHDIKMSYDAKLTFMGKLFKFFYQVPEIYMNITYSDGSVRNGRVLLDVLDDGTVVNRLPYDMNSLALYINKDGSAKKAVSFSLYGNGLKFYRDKVTVSFCEDMAEQKDINANDSLSIVTEVDDPRQNLAQSERNITMWVDSFNGSPLSATTTISNDEWLQISGWALDDIHIASPDNVYLQIGDSFYQLRKTDRSDVAKAYGSNNYVNCGYEGLLMLEDYRPGTYPVSLIAILSGGDRYCEIPLSTLAVAGSNSELKNIA